MDVFLEMLDSRQIDKVSVDADQADTLLHLLDAVVIKLEGGTEEDLQILNVKPMKPMIPKDTFKEKENNKNKSLIEKKSENRYYITSDIYIYIYSINTIHLLVTLLIAVHSATGTNRMARRKVRRLPKMVKMVVWRSKVRRKTGM